MTYLELEQMMLEDIKDLYHGFINNFYELPHRPKRDHKEVILEMRQSATHQSFCYMPDKYEEKVELVKSYYRDTIQFLPYLNEQLVHEAVHYIILKTYFMAVDNIEKGFTND